MPLEFLTELKELCLKHNFRIEKMDYKNAKELSYGNAREPQIIFIKLEGVDKK